MADFRSYLQQVSPMYLAFTGNDGRIDPTKAGYETPYASYLNQGDAQAKVQAEVDSLYNQYRGYGNDGGGGLGGGSGGTGTTVDPQAVALYDQGINQANSAIGRLTNQEAVGNENINNAFNESLNTLLQGKGRAERDYTTNKTQSEQDNVKARSNIDYQTGRKANALQRLLGSRGSGSSSAARVAAPYAAALEGTQQRNQVGDAFARNAQSLDTSWGDYNVNWDGSRKKLDTDTYQQRNALQADVAGKRQSLLSQLAQLTTQRSLAAGGSPGASVAAAQPYLNQVNDLGGQIDNLGRQYSAPIAVQTPDYKSPELASYNYDRTASPQVGESSALTDTISPYLSLLLKGKKTQPSF